MADNLRIFDIDYMNVTGVKFYDTSSNLLTFVRPQGTKSITSNGVTDVAAYESVNVNVQGPSFVTYYTGSNAPAASLGQDGDIYLQIG